MTAILSSSVSVRTLVDGSLRLQVDIEPKDAQAAFALFGKPGSPVALALISNEAAVEHDRKAQAQPPAEPLERKPLSLASKVALTCGQKSFCDFLSASHARVWRRSLGNVSAIKGPACSGEDIAADVVRDLCGVSSRRLITPGSDAASAWHTLEADYHHWQRNWEAA